MWWSSTQSPTQYIGWAIGWDSTQSPRPLLAPSVALPCCEHHAQDEQVRTSERGRTDGREERSSAGMAKSLEWQSACNYQRRCVMAKSIKMTKCWECQSVVWEGYLDTKNPTSEVNRLLSQRGDASFIGTLSQLWWGRIIAGRMLPIGEYTTTRDPPQRGARRRRGGSGGRRRRPRPHPMEESMGGGEGGLVVVVCRLCIYRKIPSRLRIFAKSPALLRAISTALLGMRPSAPQAPGPR